MDKVIETPENDIYEILDPEPIPVDNTMLWVILVAGIVLSVLLVWWWMRKKDRNPKPQALNPYEEAMKELERLADRMMQEEDKVFSVQISQVLRLYLEKEYSFASSDKTTEEFLTLIQRSKKLNSIIGEKLQSFLLICDQVKFAKQSLGMGKKNELHLLASQMVQSCASLSNQNEMGPPPLPTK